MNASILLALCMCVCSLPGSSSGTPLRKHLDRLGAQQSRTSRSLTHPTGKFLKIVFSTYFTSNQSNLQLRFNSSHISQMNLAISNENVKKFALLCSTDNYKDACPFFSAIY